MDIQRLIALVVFSFSALLLWDAWQKHNAPKQVLAPASVSTPSAVPKPSTSLDSPSAPATATTPAPQPPGAAAAVAATGGAPIAVHTDTMYVELSTLGGDIRRVTFTRVHSAQDRTKPLTLLEPDPKHFFITQSGLLGDGLPSHKTVYEADSSNYTLAPGQDTLEVRLHARDGSGVDVVKRLVFHRGGYVIDVASDVANK